MKRFLLPFLLVPIFAGPPSLAAEAEHFPLSQATKGNQVDSYFGTKVTFR